MEREQTRFPSIDWPYWVPVWGAAFLALVVWYMIVTPACGC